MDAVMDQQPIPTIASSVIVFNPHDPPIPPLFEKSAHSSSIKLTRYQNYETTDELDRTKVSKKREDPDDDVSDCSGASVDSSEEGDDGDYECDNITTWNYSEQDALPSFLPYIRGYNENTSSPCSDSPESGSTTSRTASDTPPSSSASGLAGGNARRMFMRNLDQEECLSELDDDQRTALGRVFFNTLGMLGANEADERHRSVQKRRNPRKRQKLSPPKHHGHAPASTNVILAPTTPALAPAPIAVEFPSSVSNPVDCQHPTFTLPEVQNQLLPQTPSFVPQSFMSSADDFWQMQQQQEAEDAHSLFSTGNFNNTNPSTDYEGLQGFGTQEY
jgi:hypothetical protein